METTKLKIKKVGSYNPLTKEKGFAARVITNGTAVYTDIASEATRRTTLHTAEAKLAAELIVEEVAAKLKLGYIVDMGPVGKLYPSCMSHWVETEKELTLADVIPSVVYKPSAEIDAAMKTAQLAWVKGTADAEDEETDGTPTDTPTDTPSDTPTGDGGLG